MTTTTTVTMTMRAMAAMVVVVVTLGSMDMGMGGIMQVEGGVAAASKAAMAPRSRVPPTAYVLMLRLCQDKVSPLDGVTPSCCPRPLLQLATQCCARDPEKRPSLAAVLEQLHGKVLRSIDEAAHSAGVGARRPVTALEGWRDAAERIFFGTEPAAQRCSRASRSCAHRPAPAPTTESESLQC